MDGSSSIRDENYDAALGFLYGRINYERTARGVPNSSQLNLLRMSQLLDGLGNPHDSFKAIHIAGTKGKGSTAAMIAAALSAAGYRTGLYTSPHLERLEERLTIDGVDCTPSELVELVDTLRETVSKFDQQMEHQCGSATFFEVTTAMAMLHFARRGVDAAVLEVGLGGRLDSTNICRPAVTAITSISFDHVRQLGNTLSAIAREKAGIAKPNIPLICGVAEGEALSAIQDVAGKCGAPMFRLGRDFEFRYRASPPGSLPHPAGWIDYHDCLSRCETWLDDISLGMLGSHQAANAAVAVATLRCLETNDWDVPVSAIRDGIRTARCKARVELLSHEPLVVLDTAHNLASIDALLSVLDESFHNDRRILIFAATRDKDVSGMLRRVLPRFESVILTRYVDNPRGVAPERLLELVENLRGELNCATETTLCDSPAAAWRKCQSLASPEHLVCVTGSFFLAAEMRSMIVASLPVRIRQ